MEAQHSNASYCEPHQGVSPSHRPSVPSASSCVMVEQPVSLRNASNSAGQFSCGRGTRQPMPHGSLLPGQTYSTPSLWLGLGGIEDDQGNLQEEPVGGGAASGSCAGRKREMGVHDLTTRKNGFSLDVRIENTNTALRLRVTAPEPCR